MNETPIKMSGYRYPVIITNLEDFMKDDNAYLNGDGGGIHVEYYLYNRGHSFEDKADTWIIYYDFNSENGRIPISYETKDLAKEFSEIKNNDDIKSFSDKYGLLGWVSIPDPDIKKYVYKANEFIYIRDGKNLPWVELASDWLWQSKKMRLMLKIYNDLKRNEEPIIDDKYFSFVDPNLFLNDSYEPKEMAARALFEEIMGVISGKVYGEFKKVFPSNKIPIGFNILEEKTTKHLLTAIYYDLWRLISADEPIYICKQCGFQIKNKKGRRIYCNNGCKQEAYRNRLANRSKRVNK